MPELKPILAYLSLILVCALIAFLSNDKPPDLYAGHATGYSDEYNGYTYDEVAFLFENSPACQEAAASRNQQSNGEPEIIAILAACQDLWQQTRMADSTEGMEMSSWFQVAIGALGILLLLGTLHYTSEAATSTGKTLTIAEESLEEARARKQVELRAYISLDSFKAVPNIEDRATTFISGSWQNNGNTPAKEVTYIVQDKIWQYDKGHAMPVFANNFDNPHFKNGTIGKNGVLTEGRTIGKDTAESIVEESGQILMVYFCIKYTDIFGRRYINERTIGVASTYHAPPINMEGGVHEDSILILPDRKDYTPFTFTMTNIGPQNSERDITDESQK